MIHTCPHVCTHAHTCSEVPKFHSRENYVNSHLLTLKTCNLKQMHVYHSALLQNAHISRCFITKHMYFMVLYYKKGSASDTDCLAGGCVCRGQPLRPVVGEGWWAGKEVSEESKSTACGEWDGEVWTGKCPGGKKCQEDVGMRLGDVMHGLPQQPC